MTDQGNLSVRLPYMPLWVDDLLSSENWQGRTMEERGAYMTLLVLSWSQDGLDPDPERIRHQLRLEPRVFRRLWSWLEELFPISSDARRRNLRQEDHRTCSIELREKRQGAAKKGNLARWGDRKRIANGSHPIAHSPKPKEEKKRKSTQKERDVAFEVPEGLNTSEVLEALAGWWEMRHSKKFPTTGRVRKLAITALTDLTTDPLRAVGLIDLATLKGWKSFYEPQEQNESRSPEAMQIRREMFGEKYV